MATDRSSPEFKKRKAEISREWRKKNKQRRKAWDKKNPQKVNAINRKSDKKSRNELSEWYVRKRLIASGQPVNKHTIEVKRIKLLTKRLRSLIKKRQNERHCEPS